MFPYLALLFLTIGFACIGRKFGSPGLGRMAIALSVIFLVFAGLRDESIGTDTDNYG